MKGVDVSEHNGHIDWLALKNAGINEGIRAAGLKCGAYHYSYALNPTHAADRFKTRNGFDISNRNTTI